MLGLRLSHSQEGQEPAERQAASPHPIFTTTVDWYKPPPEGLDVSRGVSLPNELLKAVSQHLIEEASTLLGDADVIPLTPQQLVRFSSIINPDTILQNRIQERAEKIDFFQKYPVDESDILKHYGMLELEEQKRRHQSIMEDAASEITRLRQWKRQLKPYLIKAVALQAGGYFGGEIVSEDLIVSFGAMGSQAVPMERRPVVAFLPKKPRHVYTGVSMIE